MQLPNNFVRFKSFSPILNSDNDWEKFDLLSEKEKERLSSCTDKIRKISSFFKISFEQATGISLAVRKFYLKDLEIHEIKNFIQKYSNINPETAQKITDQVIEKIINDDSFEKAFEANLDHLDIQKALSKYPRVGNQIISENKIQLKNHPNLVLPTIENWLKDYISSLGYGGQNTIQRSDFLFHSLNGKNLDETERKKVSEILKSFDEKTTLKIDKQKQEILFENKKVIPQKRNIAKRQPRTTNTQKKTNNIQKENFNFHQKMPFEEKRTSFEIKPARKKEFTQKPFKKASPQINRMNNNFNKKNKLPKNLVDLKDLE